MASSSSSDHGFLALPGEVTDWRLVATYAAAADAGLLDALPGTAESLAGGLGLNPQSVRVVLDALGAWSIVERDGEGRYSLGAGAPDAGAAATLWHHGRALRGWQRIGEALHDPHVAPSARGSMPPDRFQAALAVGARQRAPGLVDAILAQAGAVTSVLDLGGGHGEYAMEFSRRGIAVVMQDRPEMVEAARRRGAAEQAGVELFVGDFFEVLPPRTFDLVLVSGVTHTFDGEHVRRLFERLPAVVVEGGTLAVVTFLQRDGPVAALFAVQMLVNGGGGDTHAEGDYRRWLAGAGFRDVRATAMDGGRSQSLITARR